MWMGVGLNVKNMFTTLCLLSQNLFNRTLNLFSIQELLCLIQCGWSSHMQDIILAAGIFSVWAIWHYRNNLCFKNKVILVHSSISLIIANTKISSNASFVTWIIPTLNLSSGGNLGLGTILEKLKTSSLSFGILGWGAGLNVTWTTHPKGILVLWVAVEILGISEGNSLGVSLSLLGYLTLW